MSLITFQDKSSLISVSAITEIRASFALGATVSTDSTSDDVVSKIIDIVKAHAPTGDFIQMDAQLKALVLPETRIPSEKLQSLIQKVKSLEGLKNHLPIIYRHLILDLPIVEVDVDVFDRADFSAWDEEFRIACAQLDLDKDSSKLIENIDKYAITNQDALIAIAKLAARKNVAMLSGNIEKFGIESEKARLEIAQIAIETQYEPLCYSLKQFNLSMESRVILFIRNMHAFPEIRRPAMGFFSPEDQEELEIYPEVSSLISYDDSEGCEDDLDIPQFLKDFSKSDEMFAPLLAKLATKYDEIQEETVESVKISKIKWISLYCYVLDFAKESKPLLKKLSALLDQLETESNLQVKEQKMHGIIALILYCRASKVSTTTLEEQWPLFENIMALRDPSLRSSLSKYLFQTLENPALLEKDILKQRPFMLVSLILGSYLKQIDTHRDSLRLHLTVQHKKKKKSKDSQDGPLKLKVEIFSFTERMQKALSQDYFKDKKQMKALLRSLLVLSDTTMLTEGEKSIILRDLIFVEDPHFKVQAHSQQIVSSAQMVASLIECGGYDLLKSTTNRQELQNGAKKFLSTLWGLDILNFNEKFSKTFASWRNPNAFLIFVGKMQMLPQEEREKAMPLLKKYAQSVLEDTFTANRYALGTRASEHILKLHAEDPKLLEKWKEGARFPHDDFDVVDTDNPCDLLLCGTETHSCLQVDGDPDQSKALIAYLLDPKIRMMAIKDKKGVIVARCILRLLWNPKTEKFELFQEETYYRNHADQVHFSKMLNAACIERAKQLSISLLASSETETEIRLKAFKGTIPFEYVDASKKIQSDRGYVIDNCRYVHKHKNKPSP